MTPMNNNWPEIPGYEGLYAITKDGRVWGYRKKTYRAGWRKQSLNHRGYLNIGLRKDGKVITHQVSRLVAMTYIPNPEGKPQVNHIDGNKTNNSVDNLEWCTPSENQQHARRTGLFKNQAEGSRHGCAKLTEDDVRTIRGLLGKVTQMELAKRFGVRQGTIGHIKRGKSWKCVA